MLRENIKSLITAIAQGNSVDIEDNFNAIMASKISERLDDMRVSVAQNMFGSVVEESFDLEDYSVEELEDFMMSEEFEQLDELSKRTLKSYFNKAVPDLDKKAFHAGQQFGLGNSDKGEKLDAKAALRKKGIKNAVDKMCKEDFEQLDELDRNTVSKYINALQHKTADKVNPDGSLIKAGEKLSDKRKKSSDLAAAKMGWKGNYPEAKVKAVADWKRTADKLRKEDFERGDMGTDTSPKGSARGSSLHSMDIAKKSGYTHAVMHTGTKGGIDTYHTTKAGAEKRLAAVRKKHGIPETSTRARIAEL
jgi:hypothetical protein